MPRKDRISFGRKMLQIINTLILGISSAICCNILQQSLKQYVEHIGDVKNEDIKKQPEDIKIIFKEDLSNSDNKKLVTDADLSVIKTAKNSTSDTAKLSSPSKSCRCLDNIDSTESTNYNDIPKNLNKKDKAYPFSSTKIGSKKCRIRNLFKFKNFFCRKKFFKKSK